MKLKDAQAIFEKAMQDEGYSTAHDGKQYVSALVEQRWQGFLMALQNLANRQRYEVKK